MTTKFPTKVVIPPFVPIKVRVDTLGNMIQVQGPKGDPGKDGKNGVDGEDGEDGEDGVNGKDGTPGKNGVDGKDGVDGTPGKDGKDCVCIPSTPLPPAGCTCLPPVFAHHEQSFEIENIESDSIVVPLKTEITPQGGTYDLTFQGVLPPESTLYLEHNKVNIFETPSGHGGFVSRRVIMELSSTDSLKLCCTFVGTVKDCSVVYTSL